MFDQSNYFSYNRENKGGKPMVHEVYIDAEADTPPEVDRQIRRSVLAVLEEERVDVPCIVEVCVTDDEGIRRTNLDMRGVDRPTDVLSFPCSS